MARIIDSIRDKPLGGEKEGGLRREALGWASVVEVEKSATRASQMATLSAKHGRDKHDHRLICSSMQKEASTPS
jgi:hypothetical protein